MSEVGDPTRRFAGRAERYARFRPDYPPFVLDVLRTECGLRASHVVADVGCGTGKLAERLIENGNFVYGIEPNEEMWRKLHSLLGHHKRFVAVQARAEDTALPPASVDFVTAAQSFHWFAPEEARREFLRILRPGGWIVAVWHVRRREANAFLVEYEAFLQRRGLDYADVQLREEPLATFLGEGRSFALAASEYAQELDWDSFEGRVMSASYIPGPGQAGFEEMHADLRRLFEAHAQEGRVRLEYDTHVYFGRLQDPLTRAQHH